MLDDSGLIQLKTFGKININDPFFDSLKSDYKEFSDWFLKKAAQDKKAFLLESPAGIQAFLYLKKENEELHEVSPPQPKFPRLKVGTMKVNPHGTKLGERFIKKIFDVAIHYNLTKIYVTVFPKHKGLIKLFENYGFSKIGTKETENGIENVYERNLDIVCGDLVKDFPVVDSSKSKFLLAIKPEFHTALFPDSRLETESFEIVKDVSHTNSIHKMYICFMDLSPVKRGDIMVIYRTTDNKGPAHYRSVATSVCVVEEIKTKSDFLDSNDFLRYCKNRSVFSQQELLSWFRRSGKLYVLKMTYNIAFKKKVPRKNLIEHVGLDSNMYWGFYEINDYQFKQIIKLGNINEGLIIH